MFQQTGKNLCDANSVLQFFPRQSQRNYTAMQS